MLKLTLILFALAYVAGMLTEKLLADARRQARMREARVSFDRRYNHTL